MYVSLDSLFWGLIGILSSVTLVFLILALIKVIKLINNINMLFDINKNNIEKLCKDLPTISKNAIAITDNIKDVSEVVTETTAEVIVAKDSLIGNVELIKDILNIAISFFNKK